MSSSTAFEKLLSGDISFTSATIRRPEARNVFRDANDEMIMRLVQQGDTDALGHLFDRYSSLIEKIAVRILRDIFEAQDLVQDVFFYVYRKSHIFDPARGPLGSWLVQIAYTRAFTRRDQLKRRDLNDCARIEELADSANADISLQRLVEELSAKDLIERAFVHLTPLQQRTLQLYFFEGYSLREISSHLKQSLSNTRHHYYRGIEKMKEVLESPCVVSVAKKDEN